MENEIYRPDVVLHIEPITHIFTFAIDRKRLAIADIVEKQRDELLRKLERAIIVGTIRHNHRHAESIVERPDEMIPGCLAGGIRTMRVVLGVFGKQGAIEIQGPVNLIGGYVIKPARLSVHRPIQRLPIGLGGIKHGQCPHYVRACESERILYAPVHMSLGGQMYDAVYTVFGNDPAHCLQIAYIRLDEGIIRTILHLLEIGQIAGISQFVEIDDMVFRIFPDKMNDQVAAYETGAPGNQNGSFAIHSLSV